MDNGETLCPGTQRLSRAAEILRLDCKQPVRHRNGVGAALLPEELRLESLRYQSLVQTCIVTAVPRAASH